jgi:glycosyltransferase involved in cell wall biosynthesis
MHYLFYFLHNPVPANSGCEQRALQILQGLVKRGDQVTFVSSDIHTVHPWTESSISRLRELGCRDVYVYRATVRDKLEMLAVRARNKLLGLGHPFEQSVLIPGGLKRWFVALDGKLRPDALLMTYCWFSELVRAVDRPVRKMVDMQGLFSINNQMESWIASELTKFRLRQPVDEELFSESLREKIAQPVAHSEITLYSAFDQIITLSRREHEILARELPDSNLTYLPITVDIAQIANGEKCYDGLGVTVIGANWFNQLGVEYFGDRVFPLIRQRQPDLEIDVVGSVTRNCQPYAGLNYRGFVPDLAPIYQAAGFSVCMTYAGAGQQVKIVEFMANALPVVVLASAAAGSPVVDGENGFVVEDHTGFAQRVVQLNSDRELCREMGLRARESIREEREVYEVLPGV